jgi:hypothetical protein
MGLFETWGDVERSHRKLAHRGSYLGLVWVSPATVRRVLAAHGLVLKQPRRVARGERRPFPGWASYTRNSIWIYDCTHFAGLPKIAVFAVMDLVTRKWIGELVSAEETRRGSKPCSLTHLRPRGCSSSSRPARTRWPPTPSPSMPTLTCSHRCCSA